MRPDLPRAELEAFIAEEAARPYGERIVAVNGAYNVDQLPQRMARVDWCIVPSIWWEAFGLVISEAWMFGRPVIVSNIGAMAERVRHEVDGLHFGSRPVLARRDDGARGDRAGPLGAPRRRRPRAAVARGDG